MAGRKMSLPKGGSSSGSGVGAIIDPVSDRIKNLYPLVNESETPLPRSWSPKDKFNFIGLSQNNLRVHYKGHGKGHKDAASVRATHPIPAACGLYYFEVKIVSKGRDGYMGIGLSGSGVSMNRLPGWDKHSYGYHGDDGNSFCSSGTGQTYGPTFTTGDVIGCGINLLDNTCFYTKNGHHLGIAFTDLPVGLSNLYPTVGLQTPGEIVDANFGQVPFVFDVEDMIKELRAKTRLTIQKYPIDNFRNWEGVMNKMVMSYLVHHGYCSTAEAFAKTCGQGQAVAEDLMSMQNRQKIQRLVLEGKIEEAEKETKELYPNLLDTNPDLLFMLRCRHFVELVGQLMSPKSNDHTSNKDGTNGYHLNSYEAGIENNIHCNGDILKDPKQLNNDSIMNHDHDKACDHICEDMEVAYTNGYQNGCSGVGLGGGIDEMDVEVSSNTTSSSSLKKQPSSSSNSSQSNIESDSINIGGGDFGDSLHHNSNNSNPDSVKSISNGDVIKEKSITNSPQPNGLTSKENGVHSSSVDGNANINGVDKILIVGRELQNLNVTLRKTYGYNENNKKIMENAFSLLAYANPYESPVGWQLSSRQREPICAALNSAILQSVQLPRTPPLQVALSHAHLLLSQQARSSLGHCAFVDLEMKADNVK